MAIEVRMDMMMAKRKMSLNELSKRIGISVTNLSLLKTGKVKGIRFSTLEAICRELECQPGDFLFIAFTAISAYILSVFRDLLNDRYGTRDLNMLIYISIAWIILFQVCSLCLKGLVMALWPVSEESMTITYLCFMAISMVIIGVVDILIAVKLLKLDAVQNDLIKAYAYITLVAGVLEVSVFLSPLAIILVPVSSVVLGMILLKEKEGVEFV